MIAGAFALCAGCGILGLWSVLQLQRQVRFWKRHAKGWEKLARLNADLAEENLATARSFEQTAKTWQELATERNRRNA